MLIRMHVLISVYIQTELKWCLPPSAQYRISDSSSGALVWDFRGFDMHFCEPNQYTGILKFGSGFDSSNFVSHSIGMRKVSGYGDFHPEVQKKVCISSLDAGEYHMGAYFVFDAVPGFSSKIRLSTLTCFYNSLIRR